MLGKNVLRTVSRHIFILVFLILFSCGEGPGQQIDSFRLMDFVSSEGEATKTRIERIFLNAGINPHFMFSWDNELDPLRARVARSLLDDIEKEDVGEVCKKVRLEIDEFDGKVQPVLGIHSFAASPWIVNESPTGEDIRRWDAIKLYRQYRDKFTHAERRCNGALSLK